MYLPDLALHNPNTIDEAVSLLGEYGQRARILAGGTDLLVDLKTRRYSLDHLVSIQRVDGMRRIDSADDTLRIGALTTISQLNHSSLVRDCYSPIHDATSQMASHQIRNRATIGGNIASAVPCADMPPILMVMGASVEFCSVGGSRTVKIEAFFEGPRRTVLRETEVLTTILVPAHPPGFGAAYARLGLREGNAIAVAAVAASLQLNGNGRIRQARITLGSVSPIPKQVRSAEEDLAGKDPCNEEFAHAAELAMAAAEPISDIRGSAEYRREVVGILTQRALVAALHRARESSSLESASRRAGK